ncbi:MAG: anaerobic ribonucleoside-triphosphate reductase activating protein [Desulfobacterales bacterium]|jgi:pyruvate formate lyase activating enzyme|nr:anaerobic ribonucleoside-triphosphate reductase activating protein [Desulfobacterales bacterium]
MRIGGIQKNSLIDYPQKISCVVFAAGCNFDCPYCHNPEIARPAAGSIGLDIEDIVSFLKKRKALLDGVVVSGGEPTLQKNIFDFCQRIKSMGYPVKLDTNGSKPHIVKALIDRRLVDYIAMDVKTDPDRYTPLIAKEMDPALIRSSIQIIMESGVAHEFRTTCVKPIVNEADILTIARLIQGSCLYVLQKAHFHQSPVLHPEFFQYNNWQIDAHEIEKFRTVAADFVQTCMIR